MLSPVMSCGCQREIWSRLMRLLESRDLYVQQAALTGESLPVEKQARGEQVSARPDAENMVTWRVAKAER